MQQQAAARVRGEMTMLKPARFVVCFAMILISRWSPFVDGLPIKGPDLSTCHGVWPARRPLTEPIDCCFVDTNKAIKDFKFNLDLPIRVRRPVHRLDQESVRKYERAVELMKALPPQDPRSFESQSKIHCAYCAKAYNQFDTKILFQVHGCWLFYPFHRWFLYFYERILASLIGDDTFSIPYWAWDIQNNYHPPANVIPSFFANKNSSFYDEKRSPLHQYPYRADLSYTVDLANKDPVVLLQDNHNAMWQAMIGQARTTDGFYGGKYAKGSAIKSGYRGTIEKGPHLAIHDWAGDYDNFYGENMGPAYSAARDPIFALHHSQVDRLWLMWKSWGGVDIDDPDWLDAEFLFYDENSDLVRVNVRDSLNFSNFRVVYDELEPDWVNYTPKSIRIVDPKYAQAGTLRKFWSQLVSGSTRGNVAMFLGSLFGKEMNGAIDTFGGARRSTLTSQVSRPEVLRGGAESLAYDEVLVISGVVSKHVNVIVYINMFLELPEADESTPQHCAEFLGRVKVETEQFIPGSDPTVSEKFKTVIGLSHTMQILGITHQKSVTVTFVPQWDPKHDADVLVQITDLKLEEKRTGRDDRP